LSNYLKQLLKQTLCCILNISISVTAFSRESSFAVVVRRRVRGRHVQGL